MVGLPLFPSRRSCLTPSRALAGWFDALARQQVGDAATFNRVLLAPLAGDVRRWTWLHERYFCDGTQQPNRTWACVTQIVKSQCAGFVF